MHCMYNVVSRPGSPGPLRGDPRSTIKEKFVILYNQIQLKQNKISCTHRGASSFLQVVFKHVYSEHRGRQQLLHPCYWKSSLLVFWRFHESSLFDAMIVSRMISWLYFLMSSLVFFLTILHISAYSHLVESPRATMTGQTSRSSIHVLISAAVLRLVSRRSSSIKVKDWPPREARPCVGSHRTRLLASSSGCQTQCPAIGSLLFQIF